MNGYLNELFTDPYQSQETKMTDAVRSDAAPSPCRKDYLSEDGEQYYRIVFETPFDYCITFRFVLFLGAVLACFHVSNRFWLRLLIRVRPSNQHQKGL